ncbi:MAG: transcriptional regulator, LuxR family [Microvirga sp.]|nr:transcriptional regulator, LuxR family [Microvirga sp.]
MKKRGNQACDIFELLDALGEIDNADEIVSRFATYLQEFGFSSFLISDLPVKLQRIDPHVLINGWSLEWFERCNSKNYYKNDPVARHCFETVRPFSWDELPEHLLGTRDARLIMQEALEFGLADGLSVPLHGLFGFQAIVTMAGRHVELSADERHLVHLASIYAHGAAQKVTRRDRDAARTLTVRERDVIRWIADGKTLWEVSQILGISEAAATAHMARIRLKLDSKTTAQAVVEGIRRREITL